VGNLEFTGIALGAAAALVIYHGMRAVERWRGTGQEPASPASVPMPASDDPAKQAR
jgi:hypothetical protein